MTLLTHRLPRVATHVLAWTALALATPALANKAHQHGVASLTVAVDGQQVNIVLDAPLDGFLGFERAPRTDAERRAAADLLARLRQPASLFSLDAAAACTPGAVMLQAPVLEPGATVKGDHADIEATFAFTCQQPQALRTLDVGLFEAYSRLRRIDVQVAAGHGQSKVTLRRPARSVRLTR